MGSRKEYWCDICDDRFSHKDAIDQKLVGVRFTDNRKFVLSEFSSTDGHHVCMRCLSQLWQQAPTVMAGGAESR